MAAESSYKSLSIAERIHSDYEGIVDLSRDRSGGSRELFVCCRFQVVLCCAGDQRDTFTAELFDLEIAEGMKTPLGWRIY
eukprot:scaffold1488_cov141-Amphora_coffeaeformis.AAC.6